MIYSVFNSNILLLWRSNLAINKTFFILRLPTLRTIASILMEKIVIITFAFNKMFMEWGCTYVEVFFNSEEEEPDYASYIKSWDFKQIKR